jgi:hypothetical protein
MIARHWPLIAILVAWPLAAVTIFLSGKWVGETDSDGPRYSQCRPIDWTGRVALLCFEDEKPRPVENGGEA